MAQKKVTKREMFAELVGICESISRPDLVDFCNREIELLNKKKSSTANTKKVQEQENIKAEIIKSLDEIDGYARINDITKHNKNLSDYSNQKISSMLKKLIEEGKVDRQLEKGIATFCTV